MATVISLISSSPGPEPCRTTGKESHSVATSLIPNPQMTNEFDLDEFTLPEWQPEHHSAKKRKLSPIIGAKSNQIKALYDVDLLSEPDLPSIHPITANDNPSLHSRRFVDVQENEELDDIPFTSSAPKPGKENSTSCHSRPVFELSSESLADELSQTFQTTRVPLATLDSRSVNQRHRFLHGSLDGDLSIQRTTLNTQTPIDILESSPPIPPRNKTYPKSRGRTQTRVQENGENDTNGRAGASATNKKSEAHAQRAAEKAVKQKEREAKAKEKQLAAHKAEVNKSKINKNDTTTDMIVEMCTSFVDTAVGGLVKESMQDLHVEIGFVDNASIHPQPSGKDIDQCDCPRKIVRWKRKVDAEYDHSQDEWVPLPQERRQSEKHILLYMTALEFVNILTGCCPACCKNSTTTDAHTNQHPDETIIQENVDNFMRRFRSYHGDCIPILLIEGLDSWLRKKTNTRNRKYAAAVRAEAPKNDENNPDDNDNDNDNDYNENIAAAASERPKRGRKRKPAANANTPPSLSLITPDLISSINLHLQLSHWPVIIQHVKNADMAAVEITKFTQHLSTRPGRLAFQSFNLKSASFCMETGQVRTGDNPRDVYAKMLQAVQRVTPSMAYGIVSEYETVGDLVRGFRAGDAAAAGAAGAIRGTGGGGGSDGDGGGGGKLILQNVHKSMNRDGAWSDRKLGPMVSKRLYKIFMGRDPTGRDGIA